ncbi:MAG: serine/threonine protein kinase [Gemmatimonadetes bacterium]|nr:serine/threonine protein kinase [Gemmatimonadota bacterium]
MVRQALGDRYTVDREIAAGGAARIFLARDASGRQVALKVLRPELLPSITAQRFLREISVLQKLDHPLIARLLDYGEADWFVYYAMEYVDGPTLRQFLDKHKQAPIEPTLRNAREILDAVAHAHANGIVHRDVKPENIVLAPKGAMLVDFGIARAIQVSEGERVTRSGFTVGTSHYMSPEQAAGSSEIDHRSDLYSLGCVLFECLAGRPPYEHKSEAVVLELHQKGPIPDVRDFRREVSKPLAKVIAKALRKDPKDRWQSASELRAAMEGVAG